MNVTALAKKKKKKKKKKEILNNSRRFPMMRRTLVILLPLATCALLGGYENEGLHTFDIYVISAS